MDDQENKSMEENENKSMEEQEKYYCVILLLFWASISISTIGAVTSWCGTVLEDYVYRTFGPYNFITTSVIASYMAYKTLRTAETMRQKTKAPTLRYKIIMILLNVAAWFAMFPLWYYSYFAIKLAIITCG